MSVDKKRYRWNRNPILIEENLIIDSQTTRTQCGHEEQQQHIENTVRQWYTNDENQVQQTRRLDPSNEKISEKIDRILRRIQAWTNDPNFNDSTNQIRTSATSTKNETNVQTNTTSYVPRRSSRFLDSFRRRCSSMANNEQNRVDLRDISVARPYSMILADRSRKLRDQQRQVRSI